MGLTRDQWYEHFVVPLLHYRHALPEDLDRVSESIQTLLDQVNDPEFQTWQDAPDAQAWQALLVEVEALCGEIMNQLIVARSRIQNKLRQLDHGRTGLAGYKVPEPPQASEFDSES